MGTYLLQDSLGGNSKVQMFVNVSPAVYNMNETVCSLTFAARCRATELGQAKKQTNASTNSTNPDLLTTPITKPVVPPTIIKPSGSSSSSTVVPARIMRPPLST